MNLNEAKQILRDNGYRIIKETYWDNINITDRQAELEIEEQELRDKLEEKCKDVKKCVNTSGAFLYNWGLDDYKTNKLDNLIGSLGCDKAYVTGIEFYDEFYNWYEMRAKITTDVLEECIKILRIMLASETPVIYSPSQI